MLFEVITTGSMLGVLGASYYYRTNDSNDADKILRIAENCGLFKKDDKIRLFRRSRKAGYTEYVFKIPQGLELQDLREQYGKFKDGINNRSARRINLAEFKTLKLDRTLPKQSQRIIQNRVQLTNEIEWNTTAC